MTERLQRAHDTLVHGPKEKAAGSSRDSSSSSSSSGLSKQGPVPVPKSTDRLMACRLLVELITSNELLTHKDFTQCIDMAIGGLLHGHSDIDSAVRILAGECLALVIRVLGDKHLWQIQIALFKGFKNPTGSRSTRVALARFCDLLPRTRPRRRPTLAKAAIPVLLQLARLRDNIALQEQLEDDIPRLLGFFAGVLETGPCTHLADVLITNLQGPASPVQRAAAVGLGSLAQSSRIGVTTIADKLLAVLQQQVIECLAAVDAATASLHSMELELFRAVQDMLRRLSGADFLAEQITLPGAVPTVSLVHPRPDIALTNPVYLGPKENWRSSIEVQGTLRALRVLFTQLEGSIAAEMAAERAVRSPLPSKISLASTPVESEPFSSPVSPRPSAQRPSMQPHALTKTEELADGGDTSAFVDQSALDDALDASSSINVSLVSETSSLAPSTESRRSSFSIASTATTATATTTTSTSTTPTMSRGTRRFSSKLLWRPDRLRTLLASLVVLLHCPDQNMLTASLELSQSIWPLLAKEFPALGHGSDAVETLVRVVLHRIAVLAMGYRPEAPSDVMPPLRSKVLVANRALCLANFAQVFRLYPEWAYTTIGLHEDPPATLIHALAHLHTEQDPLVMGQVAPTLAAFITAFVQTPPLTSPDVIDNLGAQDSRCRCLLRDRTRWVWQTPTTAPWDSARLVDVPALLKVIGQLLDSTEPTARKMAAQTSAQLLPALVSSPVAAESVMLLERMITLANDSYWPVRVEVIKLFGMLDLRAVDIAERRYLWQQHNDCRGFSLTGTEYTFEPVNHSRPTQASRIFACLLAQLKHHHPRVQATVASTFASLSGRLQPEILYAQRRLNLPGLFAHLANATSSLLPPLASERQRTSLQTQTDAASHLIAALLQGLTPDNRDGTTPNRSTLVGVYTTLGTLVQRLVFPDLAVMAFPAPPTTTLLHLLVPRLQPTGVAALHGASAASGWSKDGWAAVTPCIEDLVPRCMNAVIHDWAATDLHAHSLLLALLVLLISPAACQLTSAAAAAATTATAAATATATATSSAASVGLVSTIYPSSALSGLLDLRRRYAWLLWCHSARLLRILATVVHNMPPSVILQTDPTVGGTTSTGPVTTAVLDELFDTDGNATASTSSTAATTVSSVPSTLPPSVTALSGLFPALSPIKLATEPIATVPPTAPSPLPNSTFVPPTMPATSTTDNLPAFSEWKAASPQYARLGKVLVGAYRSWCLSLRTSSASATGADASSSGGDFLPDTAVDPGGADGTSGSFGAGGAFAAAGGSASASLPAWQTDSLTDDLFSRWVSAVVDSLVSSLWILFAGGLDETRSTLAHIASELPHLVSWLMVAQRFAPASCAIASALLLRVAIWSQASSPSSPSPPSIETMLFGIPVDNHRDQDSHARKTGGTSEAVATAATDQRNLINAIVERPAAGMSRSLLMPLMHTRSHRHHKSGVARRAIPPATPSTSSVPAAQLPVADSSPDLPRRRLQEKRVPTTQPSSPAGATDLSASDNALSPPALPVFSDPIVAPSATIAAAAAIGSGVRRSTPPASSVMSTLTATARSAASSPSQPSLSTTATGTTSSTKALGALLAPPSSNSITTGTPTVSNQWPPPWYPSRNTGPGTAPSAATSAAAIGPTSPLVMLKPLILMAMRTYKERRDVAVGVATLFMVRDALYGAKLNFVSDLSFLLHQLSEAGTAITVDPTRVIPLVTELCVDLAMAPPTVLQLTSSPWSSTTPTSGLTIPGAAVATATTTTTTTTTTTGSGGTAPLRSPQTPPLKTGSTKGAAASTPRIQMTLNHIAYEIELSDQRDSNAASSSTWAACRLRQILPLLEALLANVFLASSASPSPAQVPGDGASVHPDSSGLESDPTGEENLEDRLFQLLLSLAPRVPLALAPLADLLRAMRNRPGKYASYSEQAATRVLHLLSSGRLALRDADDLAAAGTILAAVAPLTLQHPADRLLVALAQLRSSFVPVVSRDNEEPNDRSALVRQLAPSADRWLPPISLLLQSLCRLPDSIIAEAVQLQLKTTPSPQDNSTVSMEQVILETILFWIEAALVSAVTRQVPTPVFIVGGADVGMVALPFTLVCLCELLQSTIFLVQGSDAATASLAYVAAAKTVPIAATLSYLSELVAPLTSTCPALTLRWLHLIAALKGPDDLSLWAPFVSQLRPTTIDTTADRPQSRGAVTVMSELVGCCALTLIMHRIVNNTDRASSFSTPITAPDVGPTTLDESLLTVVKWLFTTHRDTFVSTLLCLADQPAVHALLHALPDQSLLRQNLIESLRSLWVVRPSAPTTPRRRSDLERRLLSLIFMLQSQTHSPSPPTLSLETGQTEDRPPRSLNQTYPSFRRHFSFNGPSLWAEGAVAIDHTATPEVYTLPTSLTIPWWWRLLETHLTARLAVAVWPVAHENLSSLEGIAVALELGDILPSALEYVREQARTSTSGTLQLRLWCALLAPALQRHLLPSTDSDTQSIEQRTQRNNLDQLLLAHTQELLVISQRVVNSSSMAQPGLDLAHVALVMLPLLQDQVDALQLTESIGVGAILRFWSSWIESSVRPPILPHALRWLTRATTRLVTWWANIVTSPSRMAESLLTAHDVVAAWDTCERWIFILMCRELPMLTLAATDAATQTTNVWDIPTRLAWLRRWLHLSGSIGSDIATSPFFGGTGATGTTSGAIGGSGGGAASKGCGGGLRSEDELASLDEEREAHLLMGALCNLHANQLYLYELAQQELVEPTTTVLRPLPRSRKGTGSTRSRTQSQSSISGRSIESLRGGDAVPSFPAMDLGHAALDMTVPAIVQLDYRQRQAGTKMDLLYLSAIFKLARTVGWTPGTQFTILQRLTRSCLWVHVNDALDRGLSSNPGTPLAPSASSLSLQSLGAERSPVDIFSTVVQQQGVQPDDVLAELGALRQLTSLLLMSMCGTPGHPSTPLLHFPREFKLPLLRTRPGAKLARIRRQLDSRAEMMALPNENGVLLPDLTDGVAWDTIMSSSNTSTDAPVVATPAILRENVERPLGLGRSRLNVSQLPVAALLQGNPYSSIPGGGVGGGGSSAGEGPLIVPGGAIAVTDEETRRARAHTSVRALVQAEALFGLLKRQLATDQVTQLLRPAVSIMQAYIQGSEAISVALPLEAIKSLVLLSDLFRTSDEHALLLNAMSQCLRTVHPDDSLSLPWITLGLCKSLAAQEVSAAASPAQIAEVTGALERLLMMQQPQQGSSSQPTLSPSTSATSSVQARSTAGNNFAASAAMAAVLYLMEGRAKAIIRPSLPLLLRFLLTHIQHAASSSSVALSSSQLLAGLSTGTSSMPTLSTPTLALCLSLAMCLIENFPAEVEQMEFARKTVASAAALAFRRDCPEQIYLTVLRSLERLLLCVSLPTSLRISVLTLTSSSVSLSRNELSAPKIHAANGLMITSLYASLATSSATTGPTSATSVRTETLTAPYLSVQVVDRIMSMFERLNSGSHVEAVVLADFLPTVLLDCMSFEQVLSSVMGEFVSQPVARPHLASVLFKVFRRLNLLHHQELVRWILSSLYPYLQKDIGLAMWSLACLFSAVSFDPFLQSFQPILVSLGHLQAPIDAHCFLTCALHFFSHELHTEDEQRDFLAVCSSFSHIDVCAQLLVLCKQLVAAPDTAEVHYSGLDSL